MISTAVQDLSAQDTAARQKTVSDSGTQKTEAKCVVGIYLSYLYMTYLWSKASVSKKLLNFFLIVKH